MVEAYKTNAAMRERYFRMNGIAHVEAWDTDGGYVAALCGSAGKGWPQDREFATVGHVEAWAKEYCPELPFIN